MAKGGGGGGRGGGGGGGTVVRRFWQPLYSRAVLAARARGEKIGKPYSISGQGKGVVVDVHLTPAQARKFDRG